MDVPGPRTPEQRRAGDPIPLARLLPAPVFFVMAGGGAHGAVQWGALQALSQTDLVPDAIVGTSAGALTGAIMAEDPASGVNRIAYVWGQIGMGHLVGEKWLTRGLGSVRSPGLVSPETEVETLEAILSTDRIEELEVDFAAVATDLATGRPHLFDSGPLIPALLASSAIPGILPPVEINNRLYVDGLASANLPAVPAVERGAGSIVVLDTGTREVGEVATSAAKVLARVAVIMAMSQRRRQLRDAASEVPVLLLPTPADLGGTLEFGNTMRAGAAGYSMTRDFLYDLVAEHHHKLTRGIYARPDDHGLTPDLRPMLKSVPG
jgi:NTE family protein